MSAQGKGLRLGVALKALASLICIGGMLAISYMRSYDEDEGFSWITFAITFGLSVVVFTLECLYRHAILLRDYLAGKFHLVRVWYADRKHTELCSAAFWRDRFLYYVCLYRTRFGPGTPPAGMPPGVLPGLRPVPRPTLEPEGARGIRVGLLAAAALAQALQAAPPCPPGYTVGGGVCVPRDVCREGLIRPVEPAGDGEPGGPKVEFFEGGAPKAPRTLLVSDLPPAEAFELYLQEAKGHGIEIPLESLTVVFFENGAPQSIPYPRLSWRLILSGQLLSPAERWTKRLKKLSKAEAIARPKQEARRRRADLAYLGA